MDFWTIIDLIVTIFLPKFMLTLVAILWIIFCLDYAQIIKTLYKLLYITGYSDALKIYL